MATLRGGPASGLQIPDGDDIQWVSVTVDDAGREIPDTDDQGQALTLPADTAAPDPPRRRWQCYRKVGAVIPELGDYDRRDDLPMPADGTTAYRWVCRRRTT